MRYLNIVEKPTQRQVLEGTAGFTTELAMNQCCWAVHYGEDGAGYQCEWTRTFFIEEQNWIGTECQNWVYNEWMEM